VPEQAGDHVDAGARVSDIGPEGVPQLVRAYGRVDTGPPRCGGANSTGGTRANIRTGSSSLAGAGSGALATAADTVSAAAVPGGGPVAANPGR
jgi:hypothetical protein